MMNIMSFLEYKPSVRIKAMQTTRQFQKINLVNYPSKHNHIDQPNRPNQPTNILKIHFIWNANVTHWITIQPNTAIHKFFKNLKKWYNSKKCNSLGVGKSIFTPSAIGGCDLIFFCVNSLKYPVQVNTAINKIVITLKQWYNSKKLNSLGVGNSIFTASAIGE